MFSSQSRYALSTVYIKTSSKYWNLLNPKKDFYEEYKSARKEMADYQTAKQNVDRILGEKPLENEKEVEKERI